MCAGGGGRGTEQARGVVVTEPAAAVVLVWVGFPTLGAGAGWLARILADWLVSLPFAPFKGPARFVTSLPEPQLTIGALALGALAGLVVAGIARYESLRVTVLAEQVEFSRKGSRREYPGHAVAAAFLDGKRLVLLGTSGEELAREPCELDAGKLRAAFAAHGYRWLDQDPYAGEFRRWVPDTPGLPEGADALLKARERALRKGGFAAEQDVAELRDELARLGVVVREEKKRQYWRLAASPKR